MRGDGILDPLRPVLPPPEPTLPRSDVMVKALPAPLLLAGAALLAAACNNGSPGGAAAAAGAQAGSGLPPLFAGIGTADAISPTEVVVSWSPAVNGNGSGGAENMRYLIYHNTSLEGLQRNQFLVHETAPGATSFVHTDLKPFETHYYKVVAVDPSGQKSLSDAIASARTPSTYGSSGLVYSEIEFLWQTESSVPGQNCLSCHDYGCDQNDLDTIPGNLDLSCFEGVMAGVGTTDMPDTFVIPSDGEATWNEFVTRFTAHLVEHADYIAVAENVLAMEPFLTDWADGGALLEPDLSPPVFEFDNIENAGKYYGEWVDFDTASVTFFHASDPESLPPDGNTEGQLEYLVFAGPDSVSIDWLNPVASIFSTNKQIPGNETMTVEFPWTGDRVSIVVRALDSSGRGVDLPPPDDPNYLQALEARWRNMSVNEREIQLVR